MEIRCEESTQKLFPNFSSLVLFASILSLRSSSLSAHPLFPFTRSLAIQRACTTVLNNRTNFSIACIFESVSILNSHNSFISFVHIRVRELWVQNFNSQSFDLKAFKSIFHHWSSLFPSLFIQFSSEFTHLIICLVIPSNRLSTSGDVTS